MKTRVLMSIMAILICITGCKSTNEAYIEKNKTNVWQPSPGHKQIQIWAQGTVPNVQPVPGAEFATITKKLIADEPCTIIENVSQPTMTVYSPKGKNTGIAIVVFPGGGYKCLAIDLEGTEVCDWLTSIGITAVLLKYRVPNQKWGAYRESQQALEDAQRTIGLLRFHAAEWHIDPHKIGVIGFSAGGHMVAAISTHFDNRLYPLVDAADKESCRPDFAIALYPGHLWYPNKSFVLNPNVPVTSNTPPTFLVHAEDDPIDNVNNSLVYYIALRKVKVPVEMHLYAHGGHAFGLRPTKFPITEWPKLVEKWLQTLWRSQAEVKNNSQPTPKVHIQAKAIRAQEYHTVRKGETLSSISYDYYGSANKWQKIFKANRRILKNPHTVRIGTKLIIPD